MSELIDRKALLDECLNHYEVGNIEQNCTMDWICKTVRNFPSASPWHKVEDGLPEKATWVLTIAKELNVTIFNIATVDAGGQWWTTSPHKIMRELYGVRYWMPIEPPKEDA